MMELARWEVRRPIPTGVNVSMLVAGVVCAVEGSRDMEEVVEGVDVPLCVRPLEARRERVGLRG